MPGIIAHSLFGKAVSEQYPERLKKAVANYPALFSIGLQGPDILFYYKPLSSTLIRRQGSLIHSETADKFFSKAARLISCSVSPKKEARLSYALGFLCHFALDSACHGYIEKKMTVDKVGHVAVEWELERCLMQENGVSGKERTESLRASKGDTCIIAGFFKNVSPKQISDSLRSMRFYDSMLCGACKWQRDIVSLAFDVSKKLYEKRDLQMSKKADVRCADSNLRLKKLMRRAVGDCLKLTDEFMECVDSRTKLTQNFLKTFGPSEGWEKILILPLEDEINYEV